MILCTITTKPRTYKIQKYEVVQRVNTNYRYQHSRAILLSLPIFERFSDQLVKLITHIISEFYLL